MNSDKAGSAIASGGTPSKPPATTMGESEFLTAQAQAARKAMGNIASEMGECVRQLADPRVWTREHPIAALGVAGALGLLAGAALAGSRDEPLADRLARLLRQREKPADNGTERHTEHTVWKFARPALKTVGGILLNQIGKAVASQLQPVDESANGNGHAPAEPADPAAQV